MILQALGKLFIIDILEPILSQSLLIFLCSRLNQGVPIYCADSISEINAILNFGVHTINIDDSSGCDGEYMIIIVSHVDDILELGFSTD